MFLESLRQLQRGTKALHSITSQTEKPARNGGFFLARWYGERNQKIQKFTEIGRGYIPYAIRLAIPKFRAKLLPMNEIICTITMDNEVLELCIEQTDPGIDFNVMCASLNDEDGPLQIEYFESSVDTEPLELIQVALETIQNGIK